MNEIEKVLSFFKTAEDWNSFVELSNMKDMMVRELKRRLLTEMRIIAESNLSGAGWEYDAKDDYISIVLQGHHALSICIEWRHWSWYKRGAGIWIDPSKIAPEDFIGNVNANADLKGFLTDNGFHESRKNAWYPFNIQFRQQCFTMATMILVGLRKNACSGLYKMRKGWRTIYGRKYSNHLWKIKT